MAALLRVMPPGWLVWPENPIVIGPKRVPLPDYAVIRGAFDDYIDRSPGVADVGLVVELSDSSSLKFDTGVKLGRICGGEHPGLLGREPDPERGPLSTRSQSRPNSGTPRETVYTVGQSVPLRLDGVVVAEIPTLDLLPIRA